MFLVATKRPRKNLFLSDELEEMLRTYAHDNRISESEVGRQAFDLFLNLAPTDEYKSALDFAERKDVHISLVIEQMLRKMINDGYI